MKTGILLPMLLLFILAAGCIGGGQEAQQQPPAANESKETAPVVETVKEVPRVSVREYPTTINSGESAFFKWTVTGAKGFVPNTAVYIGKESVKNVGENVAPSATAYTMMTQDYMGGSYAVPGEFSGYIKIDEPGTYYGRAHTVVGGKNVWSDEFSFSVLGVSGQPVKEFTIQVSNSGFQPKEINVKKGDLVIITFVVSKDEAHPNGMRILSPAWKETPVLMPGSTQRVEFTADSTFEYRLFWLAGNLLKATGKVNVE